MCEELNSAMVKPLIYSKFTHVCFFSSNLLRGNRETVSKHWVIVSVVHELGNVIWYAHFLVKKYARTSNWAKNCFALLCKHVKARQITHLNWKLENLVENSIKVMKLINSFECFKNKKQITTQEKIPKLDL